MIFNTDLYHIIFNYNKEKSDTNKSKMKLIQQNF